MTRWRRRRPRGDGGSALVESTVLAVLLLVPLVYLVVVLGRLQAGAFAVEAAARSAARSYAAAPTEALAADRARAAVRLALDDQGFEVDPDAVTQVTCEAAPCLQPEARISVRVSVDVTLPGVPAGVDAVVPLSVAVEAESVAVVDRFGAGAP